MNSVADLQCFQCADIDFKPDEVMTVPQPTRRHSGDHSALQTTVAFTLSPMDESDEFLENPLNTAMIVDSTASGFLWSKRRDEAPPNLESLHDDRRSF